MPFPRWLARFNLHVTNRVLGPPAAYLPGMGVVVHTGEEDSSQVPHAGHGVPSRRSLHHRADLWA